MGAIISEIKKVIKHLIDPKEKPKKNKIYNHNGRKGMGVIINGKSFKCSGSISIVNGVVSSSNGTVYDCNLSHDKVFNIKCDSSITSVMTDTGDVSINGDVTEGVETKTGDIKINYKVTGDVKSKTGDINIGGEVGGSVSTVTGDIEYKR